MFFIILGSSLLVAMGFGLGFVFVIDIRSKYFVRFVRVVAGIIALAFISWGSFTFGYNVMNADKIETKTLSPLENIELIEEIYSISVGTESFTISNGDVIRYTVLIDGAYVYKTLDIRTPVYESDNIKPGVYNRAVEGRLKIFTIFRFRYVDHNVTDQIIIVPVGTVAKY